MARFKTSFRGGLVLHGLGFSSAKSAVVVVVVSVLLVSGGWFLAFRNTAERDSATREIEQLIAELHKKNVQAKGRALASLRDQFRAFRQGVPAFADDINSFGTRVQILSLLVGEKIDNWIPGALSARQEAVVRELAKDRKKVTLLEDYVGEKFRRHVVSEDKLRKAITDAIKQYHSDLTANRNECLRKASTLRFPSGHFSIPKSREGRLSGLQDETRRRIEELARGTGEKSLSVEIASATGSYVLQPTVTLFLIRISRSLLTSLGALLAGPSVAAELGVLCGGTGTLGGPAGTVIGVASGVAIGWVIDSALSADIKVKLTKDLGAFLNATEKDIIEGPIKLPNNKQKGGLRDTFDEAGNLTENAVHQTLNAAFKEEKR